MNIEKNINKPKMKKFNGKGIKKALVSSMLALTLVANPTSGVVNNNANAKTKPTIKMYGKKNYTVYTGESLKIGKTVPKYKGKKLAAKKFKVTVKKNDVSYPAIANNIKNNKAVTFASSGTYNVTYKATSPVGTTKTATRKITVLKNIKDDLVTTTEQSKNNKGIDYLKYNLVKEKIGDTNCYVSTDKNQNKEIVSQMDKKASGKFNFIIENDCENLTICGKKIYKNNEYLKLLKNIKVYDENGNDISSSVLIINNSYIMDLEENPDGLNFVTYIYVQDENGNSDYRTFITSYANFKIDEVNKDFDWYAMIYGDKLVVLDDESFVLMKMRKNNSKNKALIKEK